MKKFSEFLPQLVRCLGFLLIPLFGGLALGLIFGWKATEWATALAAPEFTTQHVPLLRKQPMLVPHIFCSFGALLIGLKQVVFKGGQDRLHRGLGYAYVVLVVGVVITGAFLLPHIFGGWLEGVPGVLFGLILLPFFTFRAVWRIRKRQVRGHRADMMRSVALLAAAIAIRMVFPGLILCGVPERIALGLAFCMVWPLSLAYAEWRLRAS